jgi:pyruvoyl-dependent arginine decarboxylase (PvlArgDC)
MHKLANEYTIEPDFSILAGPYSSIIPQEMKWLENVVADMKAGNIKYRVTANGADYYVERKGMIVTKRK